MLRLREQVVERLIDERLVAQGAAREGIEVSDAELADQIMRIGAFQEGGRFSRDRYVRLLAMTQPPMTPADFEADFRTELVRQRLQALIAEGAKVSEAEARQAWEVDRSRVRAAYLLVPAGTGEALQATDAELEALLQGAPRRVHPARAPPGPGGRPPGGERAGAGRHRRRRRGGVQGPPGPVRAAGPHEGLARPGQGARRSAAARPRTRPRPGPRPRSGRIRGGADFAQVAKEMSEDPSTASRGGDLGLIAAGRARARGRQGSSRASSRARSAAPSGAPSATTSSRCSRSCRGRGRS